MAATKPDDLLIPFNPAVTDLKKYRSFSDGYSLEIRHGELLVNGCDCDDAIEDVDTAERIAAAITAWAQWKRQETTEAS
jgi:hypothetical protein